MTQCTIDMSQDGTAFILTFPARGNIRAHSVRIPIDLVYHHGCEHLSERAFGTVEKCSDASHQHVHENKTVATLMTVLTARRQAEEADAAAIQLNSKAEPTQALIDEFFRKGGKVEDKAARQERKLREEWGDDGFAALMAAAEAFKKGE